MECESLPDKKYRMTLFELLQSSILNYGLVIFLLEAMYSEIEDKKVKTRKRGWLIGVKEREYKKYLQREGE